MEIQPVAPFACGGTDGTGLAPRVKAHLEMGKGGARS
jgi:hypothetical protein